MGHHAGDGDHACEGSCNHGELLEPSFIFATAKFFAMLRWRSCGEWWRAMATDVGAVTMPAVGSTGEGRCCSRRRGATMDATRRQDKRLLWSTTFLLRAATASIGSERVRRGKWAWFGERGSSAAEDERGVGLPFFYFYPLLFCSSAFCVRPNRTVYKSYIVWPTQDRPKLILAGAPAQSGAH